MAAKLAERLQIVVRFNGTASQFNRSLVGQTEALIKSIGDTALFNPHILYVWIIDEIHTLAQNQRQSAGGGGGGGHKADALSTVLSMAASDKYRNLVLIGCTDRKEVSVSTHAHRFRAIDRSR